MNKVVLSTILKFLKRCEDDTFTKVMLDVGGGNLTSPQVWIDVLIQAEVQEPSCRLEIALNIGPVVRCMCKDIKRQFFKSNKHWTDSIQVFVCLIHNMILSGFDNSDEIEGKKIIDTLLNYEGLLSSIVQWGFWEEECRPDIAKEIVAGDLVDIVESGNATLNRLIEAADPKSVEGRERLEFIGTIPIISKEYDPECTISLVAGWIRQIKIEGWTYDISESLRRLISNVSCVDKDVITGLIDLGINTTSDDEWVVHVAVVLDYMILKRLDNENFYSNDTRIAFAIRSGLIELCLTFVERFGLKESFDEKWDSLSSPFASIKSILTHIYWIGLHKKTAKAIRSKRCSIEQELSSLEQNADITNNVSCKKLLYRVKCILEINGPSCCRCNKSLSKTEVKLCNGCGCMAYCSKACQKEDWQNGHNVTCCKTYTVEKAGRFQGRFIPMVIPNKEREASKLKELEVNMNMIQLKLFLSHSETILNQARALGVSLSDCVVKFDLDDCPLEVTTHEYNDVDDYKLKRGFEESRSKENITCIYNCFIYDGTLAEGELRTPCLQMQRLFPHELLSKRKAHEIDKYDRLNP